MVPIVFTLHSIVVANQSSLLRCGGWSAFDANTFLSRSAPLGARRSPAERFVALRCRLAFAQMRPLATHGFAVALAVAFLACDLAAAVDFQASSVGPLSFSGMPLTSCC